MTEIQNIGTALVALLRQSRAAEAIAAHYADDAVSVEANDDYGPRTVTGRDAILDKNRRWEEAMDVHETTTSGPLPHGDDRFALTLSMDVTHRESGQRLTHDLVAVYTVGGGKIVKEELFYVI